MVLGGIVVGVKIAQKVWKYRKQIYSVISAQDRYIKGAFVGTRVSKAAQYGWRSGAALGGLTGSLIAPDTPGNDIAPTVFPKKQPSSYKSYKTRYRRTRRSRAECARFYKPRYRGR